MTPRPPLVAIWAGSAFAPHDDPWCLPGELDSLARQSHVLCRRVAPRVYRNVIDAMLDPALRREEALEALIMLTEIPA